MRLKKFNELHSSEKSKISEAKMYLSQELKDIRHDISDSTVHDYLGQKDMNTVITFVSGGYPSKHYLNKVINMLKEEGFESDNLKKVEDILAD